MTVLDKNSHAVQQIEIPAVLAPLPQKHIKYSFYFFVKHCKDRQAVWVNGKKKKIHQKPSDQDTIITFYTEIVWTGSSV